MRRDATLHNMLDDVTRQFFTGQGRTLSPSLYDALDIAIADTRRNIKHSRDDHPHLHALSVRADLRAALNGSELPDGWQLSGNPRRSEQMFLQHPTSASSLRVLSESTVTTNGIPHAGHTQARQAAWGGRALFADPTLFADRDLLLLLNIWSEEPSMRIVHTIRSGRYRGNVPCDFQVPILRDISAMPERFEGSDEYEDLFDVSIEEFEVE